MGRRGEGAGDMFSDGRYLRHIASVGPIVGCRVSSLGRLVGVQGMAEMG